MPTDRRSPGAPGTLPGCKRASYDAYWCTVHGDDFGDGAVRCEWAAANSSGPGTSGPAGSGEERSEPPPIASIPTIEHIEQADGSDSSDWLRGRQDDPTGS